MHPAETLDTYRLCHHRHRLPPSRCPTVLVPAPLAAGNMPVKPNKYVEEWGVRREHIENEFRCRCAVARSGIGFQPVERCSCPSWSLKLTVSLRFSAPRISVWHVVSRTMDHCCLPCAFCPCTQRKPAMASLQVGCQDLDQHRYLGGHRPCACLQVLVSAEGSTGRALACRPGVCCPKVRCWQQRRSCPKFPVLMSFGDIALLLCSVGEFNRVDKVAGRPERAMWGNS